MKRKLRIAAASVLLIVVLGVLWIAFKHGTTHAMFKVKADGIVSPIVVDWGPPVEGAAFRYDAAGGLHVLLLDRDLFDLRDQDWRAWITDNESKWLGVGTASASAPLDWKSAPNADWVAQQGAILGVATGVQSQPPQFSLADLNASLAAHRLPLLENPATRWSPDGKKFALLFPIFAHGSWDREGGGTEYGPYRVLIASPDPAAPVLLVELGGTKGSVNAIGRVEWSEDSRFLLLASGNDEESENVGIHRRAWIVPAPDAAPPRPVPEAKDH